MFAVFYSDNNEYFDKLLDVYPDYDVAELMARIYLPKLQKDINYAIVPILVDDVVYAAIV